MAVTKGESKFVCPERIQTEWSFGRLVEDLDNGSSVDLIGERQVPGLRNCDRLGAKHCSSPRGFISDAIGVFLWQSCQSPIKVKGSKLAAGLFRSLVIPHISYT